MTDYYDGPRRGVAEFEGSPHFYDSEWTTDPYGSDDAFLLTPIDDQLLQLALENWAIWRRWETAFHEGRADNAGHPALPEERARQMELDAVLATTLVTDLKRAVRVRGLFRFLDVESSYRGWRPLEVEWTRR